MYQVSFWEGASLPDCLPTVVRLKPEHETTEMFLDRAVKVAFGQAFNYWAEYGHPSGDVFGTVFEDSDPSGGFRVKVEIQKL